MVHIHIIDECIYIPQFLASVCCESLLLIFLFGSGFIIGILKAIGMENNAFLSLF